jgi:hypothetical protein
MISHGRVFVFQGMLDDLWHGGLITDAIDSMWVEETDKDMTGD